MILCGLNDTNILTGFKTAAIFAVEIFTDEFTSSMDNRFEELGGYFNTLYTLSVSQ